MKLQHSDSSCLIASATRCCSSQLCEEAIGYLEAAGELQPGNLHIQYKLGVCYSGACRQHSLTDLQLAHVHFKKALMLCAETTDSDPLDKARILGALGNTYSCFHQMPLKARLWAAIDCYASAASIYQLHQAWDDWGREEFNLGNAFSELPEESLPDKWKQAIYHYENALQVRTRDKHPEAHAGTLQNLGIALRELLSGNRFENIKRSIGCYRSALLVHRSCQNPRGVAVVQNNIGNSFLSLATLDTEHGLRHVRRALRHYERALSTYSEKESPVEFAMALFNRGQALIRFAALSRSQAGLRLAEACECFHTVAHLCEQMSLFDLLKKTRDQLQKFCARYEQDETREAIA